MFKIDKGVPIPERALKPRKYPWREMEIGDSFVFPNSLENAKSQASTAGKAFGRSFRAYRDGEKVRVWRTE